MPGPVIAGAAARAAAKRLVKMYARNRRRAKTQSERDDITGEYHGYTGKNTPGKNTSSYKRGRKRGTNLRNRGHDF